MSASAAPTQPAVTRTAHESSDVLAEILAEAHGLTLGASQENDGFLRHMIVDQVFYGLLGALTRIKYSNSCFHGTLRKRSYSRISRRKREIFPPLTFPQGPQVVKSNCDGSERSHTSRPRSAHLPGVLGDLHRGVLQVIVARVRPCKIAQEGKPTGDAQESNFRAHIRLTFAFFSPKVGEDSCSTHADGGRKMALTKRQKEVLDFLVSFETKHGYAPSFEEIGKGLKLTSLATVHKHISTLEKKGFIRRGYNQSRSIEILQLPKSVREQVIERKVQELPLLGRIAAGRPLEAVEERETLSLGDFARGGNSFALQVKGSSMIEDHIMDGDFVVCEQTQVANAGDIIVALIGGEEATLKRFYREPAGKIRLQPANSEMEPIFVAASDLKIQGRVIGVLRKY
jgi:repressor LexA